MELKQNKYEFKNRTNMNSNKYEFCVALFLCTLYNENSGIYSEIGKRILGKALSTPGFHRIY